MALADPFNTPPFLRQARSSVASAARSEASMSFSFLQHIADFSDSDLARPAAAIASVNESPRRLPREAAWSCTLDLIARYTPLSCTPASSPLNWRTRMRIPILLALVGLALAACNANQAINPSGQADHCADDPTCNPYNPSSYAQNNIGIGR